jgi:hypothetical protein
MPKHPMEFIIINYKSAVLRYSPLNRGFSTNIGKCFPPKDNILKKNIVNDPFFPKICSKRL